MATTSSVSPTTVERNTSRRSHNNSIPHRSQSTRVKSSTADSPQRSHSHHHRGSSRHAAIEESVPQANYETANVAQQSRKISSRDGPTPSRHESTRSATSNHRSNHHTRHSNDMATAAANGGGPAPVVTPQESRHAAHRGKSRTSIPAQSGTWVLGKTIGQGSMGKVKLARKSEGGEQVAVKIVPRGSTDDNHNQSRADRERADHSKEVRTAREAAIVTLLDHPYICGMRDVVRTTYHWYMLFEYVNGGQMLDYIISHGRLKEKQARKFSRQIASALDYCHRNSIVHRDLKIENILISKTGDIKIIDFGLSNLFAPRNHLKTFCGSLYFAAPELLQAKAYTGPEVDVWSFGIVLYVLVCGKVPFDDQSMPALHAKIKRGIVDYPNWLSPECKHLISRMLVTDPKQRATLQEIMTHQWMTKQYGGPPENYLPVREPLTLPLDDDIINDMTGFDFGPPELIKQQLTDVIKSSEYGHAVRLAMQEREHAGPPRDLEKKRGVFDFYKRRNSTTSRDTLTAPSAEFLQLGNDPCNAYHPLISVYYLVKEKRERDALEANPNTTAMPRVPGEAPLQMGEIAAPKPAYTNATAYEMPGEKATGGRSRPRARTHGEEEVTEGLKNMKLAGSTAPPSPAIVEPVEPTARKESTAAGILRRFTNESSSLKKSFSVRRHRDRDGDGHLRPSGSERQHSDLLTPRSAEASGASKLGRSTSVNSAEYRRRENRRGDRAGAGAGAGAGATAPEAMPPRVTYKDPPPTSGSDHSTMNEKPAREGERAGLNPRSATMRAKSLGDASGLSTERVDTAENVKPVFLKGLFSVSTTSTKPVQAIRADIIRVLKVLGVDFTEIRGGFSSTGTIPLGIEERLVLEVSWGGNNAERDREDFREAERSPPNPRTPRRGRGPENSFSNSDASDESVTRHGDSSARAVGETSTHVQSELGGSMVLEFEIFIVKVPLLSLHGIQFKKLRSGGTWQFKNMADQILRELRL
ncbi:hypothetical protein DID88_007655 [Monilinia fructigena]|uniref:non-specific serine/threonine protein kinase n=1 Tax=Monilinia fructigena TaxID=38457 RepID=A0A395J5C7_9HELO|nr:hypothetical protein DID88_007655 [Monilinia fructigena]